MFRQFLILEMPLINRLLGSFNFIIIQYQNILHTNLIYQVYQNCIQSRIIWIKTLLISTCLAINFMSRIVNSVMTNWVYFITFISKTAVAKYIKSCFNEDNQEAIVKRDLNIEYNGYSNYVVGIDQLQVYFSQQALIGYLYFILFQLILLYNWVLEHPKADYNYYFLYVHKVKENEYGNYTMVNFICFNLVLFIFIVILVMNKRIINMKILSQINDSQPFIAKLMITFGLISQIN